MLCRAQLFYGPSVCLSVTLVYSDFWSLLLGRVAKEHWPTSDIDEKAISYEQNNYYFVISYERINFFLFSTSLCVKYTIVISFVIRAKQFLVETNYNY